MICASLFAQRPYDANIESLYNLHENLSEYNLKLEEIPYAIQYNKRDLPEIIPVEDLQQELNQNNLEKLQVKY